MTEAARLPVAASAKPWWQGAAIYQIYPRSFADSNGDGIGDLPGITARLGHVASLGVDGIWLSPFFPSPMNDFGYDVSDYTDVDPIFGTLADFDALIARAHGLGLRVIIDQVYAHTSDAHAWFADSRASRSGDKADWYVWADAKPDGSPPNNWQSVFGGPGWTWDARRRQYYFHNFLSSQPQLNGHNPAVQDALLASAKFWLDRGADGFRVDAINFMMHDPLLRDNPPAPSNTAPTRPFDFQQHIYNQSHPDIPHFLERLRALTDSYGDRFTVAEIGGDDAAGEMHSFTADSRRLDSAYGFDFLYADRLTPRVVRDALLRWPETEGTGWPSWAFENHDAPRAVSRWVTPEHRGAFARMKMLLLACLRGNIFLYNGEELGLTQAEIPFDRLRDREAIANWPLTLGRDGARVPMPWTAAAENFGFSTGQPWLPVAADYAGLAVDRQEADPASQLHLTRQLLAFRNAHAALATGRLTMIEASETLLAFERAVPGERLLCVFNFAAEPVDWQPADASRWQALRHVNSVDGWSLGGFAGLVLRFA